MAFLTNRVLLWVITSAGLLGVIAAVYGGAINKGIKLRDALWKKAVTERQVSVREKNHDINMQSLENEEAMRIRIMEIKRKWKLLPSSEPQ